MKPEQLAKSGTESAEQAALFCHCTNNVGKYPELAWYFAVPNGGSRGNDATTRAIRGARLIAEGVKPGVSDTCLLVKRGPYSGLLLELKRRDLKPKRVGSKGGCSDEQLKFGEFVTTQGFYFAVCYGWEEAWSCVEWYLNLK